MIPNAKGMAPHAMPCPHQDQFAEVYETKKPLTAEDKHVMYWLVWPQHEARTPPPHTTHTHASHDYAVHAVGRIAT